MSPFNQTVTTEFHVLNAIGTLLYTSSFALGLLISAGWEIAHKGGLQLPARAAAELAGGWDTALLVSWMLAAAYTGWRGMDREALS